MYRGALMTDLDPHSHLLVLRDATTGKPRHVPLADLGIGPAPDLDSLATRLADLLKPGETADPRVDALRADLEALRQGIGADPRVEALIARVAAIERALVALADRALAGAP